MKTAILAILALVFVAAAVQAAPTITVTPAEPDTASAAKFSSSATSGVKWDFGDGNTSTDASPSHQYKYSGIYRVSVTAAGATAQQDLKVHIPAALYIDAPASQKGSGATKTAPKAQVAATEGADPLIWIVIASFGLILLAAPGIWYLKRRQNADALKGYDLEDDQEAPDTPPDSFSAAQRPAEEGIEPEADHRLHAAPEPARIAKQAPATAPQNLFALPNDPEQSPEPEPEVEQRAPVRAPEPAPLPPVTAAGRKPLVDLDHFAPENDNDGWTFS